MLWELRIFVEKRSLVLSMLKPSLYHVGHDLYSGHVWSQDAEHFEDNK